MRNFCLFFVLQRTQREHMQITMEMEDGHEAS